ncbi:MAG: hypothetical protein V1701_11455 [Planctomycetota bacterium]
MKQRFYASVAVLMVISLLTLAGKPGGGGGNQKPSPGDLKKLLGRPDAPAGEQSKTDINWQAASLVKALSAAKTQKKILYVYFYFENKEEFPSNYDETLKTYSEERAVFAKVFVKTDTKNKIVDPDAAEFFAKNKFSNATTQAIIDCYGNFLSTVISVAFNKITAAIDAGDKKTADIESDLNTRLEKAQKIESAKEKKMPDIIKAYQQIASDKYQGYPAVEKAQKKIREINRSAVEEHNKLVKEYLKTAEDEREPDALAAKLEELKKTYKGLPCEKDIQENLAALKKGALPQAIAEPEPEPAPAKEEPKKNEPVGPANPADKTAPGDKSAK